MGKRVATIQSSYIPWKGYFDIINCVDEFILLDDVQFTKRDWRNRNRIRSRAGTQWLTIPVVVKGRYHQRIDETMIADLGWARRHWATLAHTYARARYFDGLAAQIEPVYLGLDSDRLSRVNRMLLECVCAVLGIQTRLTWSTDYELAPDSAGERILALCLAAGADEYVSGPSARSYLDVELFARHGIRVRWCDYDGYPDYPQLAAPCEHQVSILDLLFNTGPDAPSYMKTFDGGHGEFL